MTADDVYRTLKVNHQNPVVIEDGRTTNTGIRIVETRCLLKMGCDGVAYTPRVIDGEEESAGFFYGCSTFLQYQILFDKKTAVVARWTIMKTRYCL